MVAPALESIRSDFAIQDEVISQLTLSIFVLAYAIGPLFLGPLSEIYGRVIVLQLANLFFLVFNIACGVAQTKAQMIVFRFLSGLGGSAPLAVSEVNHLPTPSYSLDRPGRRRRPLRLLQTRRTRQKHCHIQPCTPPRPSRRPYRRRLHRRKHHLALGLLLHLHRRRRHPSRRSLLPPRNLRSQDPPRPRSLPP